MAVPIAMVLLIMLLNALIEYTKIGPQTFQVEIEFTDGTKRTIQFESEEKPKVTDEGCLYDYSKRSWICGVRDMSYKICSK